ncbi:MAG: N-acetylneuraminate synthase family protein [Planctomycetota bacterium]
MNIAGRDIGDAHAPYIIAEIGVNHDGSLDRALTLIEACAHAGADAVKLQHFETERLMSRAAVLAAYQKAGGENDPIAMLRRLELSIDQHRTCVRRAHELGIHAILSVFSTELVEDATAIGMDAFKSASPDIIHKPLLAAMARTNLPMIVSTGTATMPEVERANGWLRAHPHVCFLHCVSSYPTPDAHASLGAIGVMHTRLRRVIGYSDHTARLETAGLAVAAGARILEKHVTHDRCASGPDHAASLEPDDFARYVSHARLAHTMLGDTTKHRREIERDVAHASRQSICSTRAMDAGHVLTDADMTIKRPGTGLPPFALGDLIGCRLARAIEADVPICEGDLA